VYALPKFTVTFFEAREDHFQGDVNVGPWDGPAGLPIGDDVTRNSKKLSKFRLGKPKRAAAGTDEIHGQECMFHIVTILHESKTKCQGKIQI